MKLIANSTYDLLVREIDYWRDLFEKERLRADRAVDSLIELSGRPPISSVVREERAETVKAVAKMQESLAEIFIDEITDDESGVDAVAEAKEELKIHAEEFAKRHAK